MLEIYFQCFQVKREEDPFIRETDHKARETEVREKRDIQAPEEIRIDPRTLNIATMVGDLDLFIIYFNFNMPLKFSV